MQIIYLVTGAAGHLGSTVLQEFLARGERARALVLPGERNIPPGGAELCYGDVCDRESLLPFFREEAGFERVLIHCAGLVSIASGYHQQVYDVNVGGTKNIVDLCLETGVKKLVYVSSVHAIPEKPKGETIGETSVFDPKRVVGLYAKTKSEATAYVLSAVERGLDASVVHPSGIIGPNDNGQGHLGTLISEYCHRRLGVSVTGGYDFVDVRDVAEGVLACAEKGAPGECYILSNDYYSITEILNMLHEITGVRKIRAVLPGWLARLAAPFAELWYKLRREPPIFSSYAVYTIQSNASFSHQKASAALGYNPRNIRDTLRDTVAWMKAKGRL